MKEYYFANFKFLIYGIKMIYNLYIQNDIVHNII